jgi:hypothetical protein
MTEPDPQWTKSKWTHADLDDQDVEFEFPLKNGQWIAACGKFLVAVNPQGLLYVQIRVDVQGEHWAKRYLYDFQLSQVIVDRIERHPEHAGAFQAKLPRS